MALLKYVFSFDGLDNTFSKECRGGADCQCAALEGQ